MAGPKAYDSAGNHNHATYEPHITYFLEGPHSRSFCEGEETNRAAMFVGERLRSQLPTEKEDWSISLWFWNGMPNDGREVSGWILSYGNDHGISPNSLHLGIGGNSGNTGQLVLQIGDNPQRTSGKTITPRWDWQHLVLTKQGNHLKVFLNGKQELESKGKIGTFPDLFFGGRSDNQHNWEGRLDEICIFDRTLSPKEIEILASPNL